LDELEETQALLDRAGARGPRFFRPPGGGFNGKVLSAARAAGYHMVLWTDLPRDHEAPPPDVIRRRVLSELQDGGVLLMHSGIESTARVLPELLRDLRARGYRCVTVGEFLAEGRASALTSVWLDPLDMPKKPALPPESALEEGEDEGA
jgi:peptidoglycan/xylan/chitin deacetylase (PgdA/CDA1 family)